jgi:hypothetical protein
MMFFEWGVAMHDLEVENVVKGKRDWEENKALRAGILRKIKRQTLKDYVLFPLLTGPFAPLTLAGNVTANLVRNVWTFNIIFCGHFPAGAETFSEEECLDEEGPDGPVESRGHWYYRQLLGSANISGSELFHVMSATSPTRSSTTCSRTSRPGATPRSPRRSRRSASATGWTTRLARCAASSGRWRRRSAGSPCRRVVRRSPRRRPPPRRP